MMTIVCAAVDWIVIRTYRRQTLLAIRCEWPKLVARLDYELELAVALSAASCPLV